MPWYRPPSYYADSRWRGTWALDGGGALMNQGIHTVDLLLWLGGAVTAVQARTAALFHAIEVEDTAAAVLEFTSGALGTVFATTAAYPGWPRRITVTGTEGTRDDRGRRPGLRGPAKRRGRSRRDGAGGCRAGGVGIAAGQRRRAAPRGD